MLVAVDDIDAAADRVREIEELDMDGHGAAVETFGHFKVCKDDPGSRFGLHQRPR